MPKKPKRKRNKKGFVSLQHVTVDSRYGTWMYTINRKTKATWKSQKKKP